jgi:hypothetical protein
MARVAICVFFCLVEFAKGEMLHLESAGARAGLPSSSRTSNFRQAEVFVAWDLPWRFDFNPQWHLQWRLNCSAGWLGGQGEDAALATTGPSLVLQRDGFPLTVEAGVNGTLLGRERFGSLDFGSLFQFTSHAGLNFEITRRVRLGYRFQHMSNGHLSNTNPGLNLHVLAASWRF